MLYENEPNSLKLKSEVNSSRRNSVVSFTRWRLSLENQDIVLLPASELFPLALLSAVLPPNCRLLTDAEPSANCELTRTLPDGRKKNGSPSLRLVL